MTDGPNSEVLDAAASALADAEHAVALTGAGMSVESGIPPYRGEGGLWNDHDESALHVRRLRAQPEAFWEDWVAFHDAATIDDAEPHAGHEALAALETNGPVEAVITQNVDGLHQAGGSEAVIELHGTHEVVVCPGCDRRNPAEDALATVRAGEGPPECDRCGFVVEPGSVLFGQELPFEALSSAREHAERCDCMLVVGCSLVVEPAGSLPQRAARTGATIVECNPEETPISRRAEHVLHDPAGELLPALWEHVRK